MNVYETVIILVTVGTALVGLVDYVRSGGPLAQLGRRDALRFEHPGDRPSDRPSEGQIDPPIPQRPLRGRLWA